MRPAFHGAVAAHRVLSGAIGDYVVWIVLKIGTFGLILTLMLG